MMMLTIHALPQTASYAQVKRLISDQCKIDDVIIDKFVHEPSGWKHLRVCFTKHRDGSNALQSLNGLRCKIGGEVTTLRVEPVVSDSEPVPHSEPYGINTGVPPVAHGYMYPKNNEPMYPQAQAGPSYGYQDQPAHQQYGSVPNQPPLQENYRSYDNNWQPNQPQHFPPANIQSQQYQNPNSGSYDNQQYLPNFGPGNPSITPWEGSIKAASMKYPPSYDPTGSFLYPKPTGPLRPPTLRVSVQSKKTRLTPPRNTLAAKQNVSQIKKGPSKVLLSPPIKHEKRRMESSPMLIMNDSSQREADFHSKRKFEGKIGGRPEQRLESPERMSLIRKEVTGRKGSPGRKYDVYHPDGRRYSPKREVFIEKREEPPRKNVALLPSPRNYDGHAPTWTDDRNLPKYLLRTVGKPKIDLAPSQDYRLDQRSKQTGPAHASFHQLPERNKRMDPSIQYHQSPERNKHLEPSHASFRRPVEGIKGFHPPDASFHRSPERIKGMEARPASFHQSLERNKPMEHARASFRRSPERIKGMEARSASFHQSLERNKPTEHPHASFRRPPERNKPMEFPHASFRQSQERNKPMEPAQVSSRRSPERKMQMEPANASFHRSPERNKPMESAHASFRRSLERNKPIESPHASFHRSPGRRSRSPFRNLRKSSPGHLQHSPPSERHDRLTASSLSPPRSWAREKRVQEPPPPPGWTSSGDIYKRRFSPRYDDLIEKKGNDRRSGIKFDEPVWQVVNERYQPEDRQRDGAQCKFDSNPRLQPREVNERHEANRGRSSKQRFDIECDTFADDRDRFHDDFSRSQNVPNKGDRIYREDDARRVDDKGRDDRRYLDMEFSPPWASDGDRLARGKHADERYSDSSQRISEQDKINRASDELTAKLIQNNRFKLNPEEEPHVASMLKVEFFKQLEDVAAGRNLTYKEIMFKFRLKYTKKSDDRMFNEVLARLSRESRKKKLEQEQSAIPRKMAQVDNLVNEYDERLIARATHQQMHNYMSPKRLAPLLVNPGLNFMLPNNASQPRTDEIPEESLYVCKNDFAPFSQAEADQLRQFLVAQVFEYSSRMNKQDHTEPCFFPTLIFKGLHGDCLFQVFPEDLDSRKFLMNLDFSSFENFPALVYSKEELSYERASIWLPGHSTIELFDPLDRLRLQNKHLTDFYLDKWKFVKKIMSEEGINLFVDIPLASVRALEKVGMLLSYELQKVKVTLKSENDQFHSEFARPSIPYDLNTFASYRHKTTPLIKYDWQSIRIGYANSNTPVDPHGVSILKTRLVGIIMKYHKDNGSSKTDFIKFGFCEPGFLSVLPENKETEIWLVRRTFGSLGGNKVGVIPEDIAAILENFLPMVLTIRSPTDCNVSDFMDKLLESNRNISGLNISKWRVLSYCRDQTDSSKYLIHVKMDPQSALSVASVDYVLRCSDYEVVFNRT